MEKIEFKKIFKPYYSPSTEPEVVTVPSMHYLMIDGKGDPNSSVQFERAVGALYSIFFTIKFDCKKAGKGPDYSVGPLEGLWWMGDNTSFDASKKDEWQWTLMLWVPDVVAQTDLNAAIGKLRIKKPNPSYDEVRLEVIEEGKVAQIMHLGPYAAEEPTIIKLHTFMEQQGYGYRGKHHEIYLGDPRRSKPEKLKTIIRHLVQEK